MSESHPEKKRDTGIDCKDPYDRENDCGKCRDPPPGRTQCVSLCKTTGVKCKRSAMPNLPTCWQHFERFIVDNPQLIQQLRQQRDQVQDTSVRDALRRTMRQTIVKTGLENTIAIEGARDLVEDYLSSKWVTWKYPDETQPLDWERITHLDLRGSEWPAKFPPNLKELRVRNQGATGILKVPETVTNVDAATARLYIELPSGIEELRGNEIRCTSRDLTKYKKLHTLKLSNIIGPDELQLGPNLKELRLGGYRHKVAPGDMFPEGAKDLHSLELGYVDPWMNDADLQKMYTFSKDKFPNLQTLSLYSSSAIGENIELILPPSVTRLVVPDIGKTSNRFFKQLGGRLRELEMTVESLGVTEGKTLNSLTYTLPPSLESLEIRYFDNVFTALDLRKLSNLSTVRLVSFSDERSSLPEIRLPSKVSTFYLNDRRIHRW